jgi:hypothetical protein
VAWVDLWHNILLCDVLVDRPELRPLKLPPPVLLAKQPRRGDPRSLRNIALLDGSFKYVQMLVQSEPASTLDHWEWELTVWSTKASSSSAKDWIAEYKLKSSEIPEPSPPMLQVGLGEAQPTLSTLQIVAQTDLVDPPNWPTQPKLTRCWHCLRPLQGSLPRQRSHGMGTCCRHEKQDYTESGRV